MPPGLRLCCAFFGAAGIVVSSYGQTIRITGTVKDVNAQPIAGAGIRLVLENISAVTDAAGAYSIIRQLSADQFPSKSRIIQTPVMVDGLLYIGVMSPQDIVRIDAYSVSGQRIHSFFNGVLGRGNYRLSPFPAQTSSGIYVLRVQTGKTSAQIKIFSRRAPLTDERYLESKRCVAGPCPCKTIRRRGHPVCCRAGICAAAQINSFLYGNL